LSVHPDLRIGPAQPPPSNRFTEKFGLAACTNGFADKTSFDFRSRQWADSSRTEWSPSWTDSLKGQIAQASGLPVSRQRILYQRCIIRHDAATVRTAGIISGVELQVSDSKKDGPVSPREVVLACTAKRLKQSQPLWQTMHKMDSSAKASTGKMKAAHNTMPLWRSCELPNLMGGKDDGSGNIIRSGVKPLEQFGHKPLWLPVADRDDPQMQRVRSLPIYTTPHGLR